MHFTIREKIIKQLFLIRHNHKYKPSQGENGLVKFVHAHVEYFLRVARGIVSQRRYNLKFDQNSILWKLFLFYET